MNVLLLLSALLSALTGVGASVRAPERAQAVAEASIGRSAVALAPARRIVRATAALPTPIDVAVPAVVAIPAVRAIPAWADRRRE